MRNDSHVRATFVPDPFPPVDLDDVIDLLKEIFGD